MTLANHGIIQSGKNQTPIDPFFSDRLLLLHGNGVAGSTDIIDSSGFSRTISNIGSTKLESDSESFGGSAIRFNGASNYIEIVSSDFSFPSGTDFTIELITKFYTLTGNQTLISFILDGSDNGFILDVNGGVLRFLTWNTILMSWSHNFTVGNRYYIGVKREDTTLSLWTQGTQRGSITNNNDFTNLASFKVGGLAVSGLTRYLNANMEEIRVSKNIAEDLSIIPITPFPDS